GLPVLDDVQPVCDVEAIAELLYLRLDEPQLRRSGVPGCEQRRRLVRAAAFAQAAWHESPQLHGRSEARRDRRLVSSGDRLDELRADARRSVARRHGDRPAVAQPEVEGLASVLLGGTFSALSHQGAVSRALSCQGRLAT